MNKTTIIYGPATSGKSRLARKMINPADNVCTLDGRSVTAKSLKSPFFFSAIEPTDTLIIIDDIPFQLLGRLMGMLFCDEIVINKRGKSPLVIENPRVIITVETSTLIIPPGESFARRFDLIQLNSIEDYYRESEKIQNA